MAVEWRNNGEPVDGEYIADVDAEDGSQPQTFKGTTLKEVADKLLASSFHASRRINELKREIAPDPKKPRTSFQPRELTADERFQARSDFEDPAKLPEAVDRIVTARLGAPLDVVRQRLQTLNDREVEEEATAAALQFVSATPDWYPTEENKATLWKYLEDHGLELTAKNFSIAFDRLVEDSLLTMKPAETAPPPENAQERIAPQQTRPRGSFATGVRASDVGSIPPGKAKPRYTRQDIDTMPRQVYAQKLTSEPGFAAAVDALTR